jgi:hypothetical protein
MGRNIPKKVGKILPARICAVPRAAPPFEETVATSLSIRGLRVRITSASLREIAANHRVCGCFRFRVAVQSDFVLGTISGHRAGGVSVTLSPPCATRELTMSENDRESSNPLRFTGA